MKARFFLGDACYSTWTKLYVLTSDGKLHCKYLDYMKRATDEQEVDFDTFKETDYSWSNYQHLQEITYEDAITTRLTRQGNWVAAYCRLKGVKIQDVVA